MNAAREILDLARWAPSGDNTQPWRFSIEGPRRIVVHARDTRSDCVYDLDGHPSQISVGALLETLALAATRFGLRAAFARRPQSPDDAPVFDVDLQPVPGLAEDRLVASIPERRVQRRPLSMRALSANEKRALEGAVAPAFEVRWFGTWRERATLARLGFQSAQIRLTIPEAYAVHRRIIDWGVATSEDRVPAQALGAAAPSLRLMQWAMESWPRIERLNRYAAGTLMPRVEMDLWPGLACAAHVVLLAPGEPRGIDDYVEAGRRLQRFWLTATSLGLQFQPQYTPLVFARYAREQVRFTVNAAGARRASRVAARLDTILGDDARRAVFMGRVGHGPPAQSRSLRLPLAALLVDPLPGSDVSASSSTSSSSRCSA